MGDASGTTKTATEKTAAERTAAERTAAERTAAERTATDKTATNGTGSAAAPARRGRKGFGVVTHRAPRSRWGRRIRRCLLASLLVAAVAVASPYVWVLTASSGHRHSAADAPSADVVLVLGAQVAIGRAAPMPFLQGRLDTAADLIRSGRAKVILVSGDADGRSGDEVAAMRSYLVSIGIDSERIVADPAGVDTYDSCIRAKQVYGVTRALVVTQSYHLPRAVTLCRQIGIDVEGVAARCDTCRWTTLAWNAFRDMLACSKAAWDVVRDRTAAVVSPPSSEVADALSRLPS